jgi:YidC/Oxa1 family membrane protein insertase
MDTQRLILFIIFSMSALFLWEAWQKSTRPPAPPAVQSAPQVAPGPGAPGVTQAPGTKAADVPVPAAPAAAGAAGPPGAPGTAGAPAAPVAAGGERLRVRTDLFEVDVNTLGGVIERVALLRHADASDPKQPYLLLQNNANRVHLGQAGLLGEGLPNHRTQYTAEPGPRELAAGANELKVRLIAPLAGGGSVAQILTFKRGSYVIDVAFEITNGGSAPISPFAYFQLTRDTKPAGFQHAMAPVSYTGPVVYNSTDNFKKVAFDDIAKGKTGYQKSADNGWVAMIEQYFVSAWFPRDTDPKVAREFFTRKLDGDLYSVGVILPVGTVAPGASARVSAPLFAGPQEQDTLKQLAKGLDLVVDYGIFTVIAAPLFWLLQFLHGFVGNWGWAIVLLTIIIKGVFYPLNATAARSMAKMKVVAPRLKALQEQYANDRQGLQVKMMEIYKEEKINPLGGCLPILVQIPVFIALYWVLLAAVELRQAPWIGWIKDLSAADPWYVLPVVYAVTAWLQVKLTPQTPGMDPMQQKLLQYMPIAFSVMFIFFPAGLVLYWLVNNVLTILQQWHVNRMLEKEAALVAARRR